MRDSMRRPALLVLLGGTGSWTGVHEKSWLEIDRTWEARARAATADPAAEGWPGPNVVLRAIDVDKERRPELGGVRLDPVEDVLLEANIGEVLEELRYDQGRQPHAFPTIAAWLPPEEARLLTVSEADRFMTNGAGLVRAFGRMTVFIDVLNKRPGLRRLDAALDELLHTAAEGQVTVYVVASAAGGTGAGMLPDILLYLQAARSRLAGRRPIKTILFLVLPGAFRSVLDTDQLLLAQANGMALVRELDRLVNVDRANGAVEVEWRPGERMVVQEPPVDTVYLVDGSRDLSDAPQLEGHGAVDRVFAAAISDAIQVHLSPASGAVIASMYRNLQPAWMAGMARYSTFGIYVVHFDWERLERSFTLRAAQDLAARLLADSRVDGLSLARAFVTGEATDIFMSAGEQEPLPKLLTEVLSSSEVTRGELVPVTSWLQPQSGAVDFPRVPNLREELPDVQFLHTGYGNDELVEEVERLKASFWGVESDHQDKGTGQFHQAAAVNVHAAEQAFVRSLRLATIAMMNHADGIGGINAGLNFLAALDRELEERGKRLEKAWHPEIPQHERDVEEARQALSARSVLGGGRKQGRYLDAEQRLLHQRVADRCLARARYLLGRLRHAVATLQQELTDRRNELQSMRARLDMDRRQVDDERRQADSMPLRKVLFVPGDPAAERLYERFVGPVQRSSLLPGRVVQQYRDGLAWQALERPRQPLEIALRPRGDQAGTVPPAIASLRELLTPLFGKLRDVSVFEALELAGQDADALVAELRRESAPLAGTHTPSQLRQTPEGVPYQDWRLVFADWRSEGPGSRLSRQVHAKLEAAHAVPEDLGAVNRRTLPASDRLVAFTARHLVDLEAFRGVEVLNGPYRRRLLQTPNPHVFAEEKGAVRIELRSEELARAGLLAEPLRRVPGDLIGLCTDEPLLRYTAAAVAGGRLRWQEIDLVRDEGRWIVRVDDHEVHLGDDRDLGAILRRIVTGREQSAQTSAWRDALEAAGRAVLGAANRSRLLEAYARGQQSGEPHLPKELDSLLKATAADLVAQLAPSNPRSIAN
jgi:hypothetical protein